MIRRTLVDKNRIVLSQSIIHGEYILVDLRQHELHKLFELNYDYLSGQPELRLDFDLPDLTPGMVRQE